MKMDTRLTSNVCILVDTAGATKQKPNPSRVAAGRANRQKRKGLTDAGRERLRQVALHHKPWQHATGPRSPLGKARAAQNGKARQKGAVSVRQARAELAGLREQLRELGELRRMAFRLK